MEPITAYLITSMQLISILFYSTILFFNLVVYIMYTALLYFVICILIFYSVNYLRSNIKWLEQVIKVIIVFSGTKDFNLNMIVSFTSLMVKILVVVKALLIFLFLIIMISSTYLYLNYDFSSNLANYFNSTIKKKVVNPSTDITISYTAVSVKVQ